MEIIPKAPRKLPPWQTLLFYSSIVILVVAFISYFVLDHFVNTFSKNLEELDETLAQERTAEETSLEQGIFSYQKKITALSKLMANHLFTTNFFAFLESVCHPKIQFSQLNLDSLGGTAALLGEAENFSALREQLLILKDKPEINNLNLSEISIGRKGAINFTIKFSLNPQLFKK